MVKNGFRFGHKYQNFQSYSDKISATTVEILSIQCIVEYFLPVRGIFFRIWKQNLYGWIGIFCSVRNCPSKRNIKSIQNCGMFLTLATTVFHPPRGLLA